MLEWHTLVIAVAQDAPTGGGIAETIRSITALGGFGVFVFGCILIYKRVLVLGREYDALKEQLAAAVTDRDEWKAMTMRMLQSTQRAVNASERATSAAEQTVGTALAATPPADKP